MAWVFTTACVATAQRVRDHLHSRPNRETLAGRKNASRKDVLRCVVLEALLARGGSSVGKCTCVYTWFEDEARPQKPTKSL